jgi:hypothetical protein
MLQVDPSVRFQAIEGWGATLEEVGIPFDEWVKDPRPEHYDALDIKDTIPEWMRAAIIDETVFGLGLNRFRLEIGPQVEMTNDNDDPKRINDEAYRFKWQDFLVQKWLLPIQQRLAERNEKLVLYISYDLRSALTPVWLLEPEEYAEMAVATLTHLKKNMTLNRITGVYLMSRETTIVLATRRWLRSLLQPLAQGSNRLAFVLACPDLKL